MTENEKKEILTKAQVFFKKNVFSSHTKNLKKLVKLSKFNYNPFLIVYLAKFFTGKDNPESIAKALIYPRILGTSITTVFGTYIQKFCSEVLSSYGSAIAGIDIEFEDQIDGRKKYSQIKSGPNTINSGDVESIKNRFNNVLGIARVNNLDIRPSDLIVGVIYGTPQELSGFYKTIDKSYPVFIGKEFWHRLTGDEHFYIELINTFGEIANEVNGKKLLDETVASLAKDIENNFKA